jgi:hypothetical protein
MAGKMLTKLLMKVAVAPDVMLPTRGKIAVMRESAS